MKLRKRRSTTTRDAYQLGFDTGAQWGYNAGRHDERWGRSQYAGIENVVHITTHTTPPPPDADA